MLTNLWFDLKYAWRLSFKAPAHAVLCIVVVALSVGLSIWSYEFYYSLSLQPLPFPGSERWLSVQVARNATAGAQPNLDIYTYQELVRRGRTVKHLGAFSSQTAVLSEGEASNSLRAMAISPALLAAMQVAPQAGRLFTQADGEDGAAATAILGYDTWQIYFAGDPAAVGRFARIDGRPVQIVGVMPRNFYAFQDAALWLPLHLPTLAEPGNSSTLVSPLVVLEKGQTAAAVVNELQPVLAAVSRDYPRQYDAGRFVEVYPARLMLTHSLAAGSGWIGMLALAVLLLGCVNVSMIVLARLLERSRELALRTALGSSRLRLLRQCLLESAVLVLLGLVLGIALAALGVRWAQGVVDFSSQIQARGRGPFEFAIRPRDLAAAAIAATALWLLSTLIPAWRVAKQEAAGVLAGGGKGVNTPGSAKNASVLVGFQVIVSSAVLVVCANMVFAVKQELGKPTSIDVSGVWVSTAPTVFVDARHAQASERLRYWDALRAGIEGRVAGARVAYSTAVPTRPVRFSVAIEGLEGGTGQAALTLPLTSVSDNYFELLGIKLRAGRWFDLTDTVTSPGVIVIDEVMISTYWPAAVGRTNAAANVLGKRIQLDPATNGPWLTIVGVVSHVRPGPYNQDAGFIYRPLRQAVPAAFHVLAKIPVAGAHARDALRAAAFAVDRDLPLHNLQTLDDYLRAVNISFTALIPELSAIGLITMILAATGLFGLISRSVAQRTQEVGIRRALGATQWQAIAVFLRQGALYLSIGIVGVGVGLVVANLTTIPNIMAGALPVTCGVLVLMATVIFAASYLPARRAVALEPGDALRHE